MKNIIKELKNELKEMLDDIRNICCTEGILTGGLYIILFTISVILSIPFLPIFLINELSKSWFNKE